ncbi:MAG: hypothetical protein H6821_05205 [Planctomycetaceae bacterium]|nr:hypothetical protein [Planctomycetaceae bacterium]
MHTDQWRYEKEFTDYHTVPQNSRPPHGGETTAKGHTMDMQVRAVRQGWLPFYPQFPENPRSTFQSKLARQVPSPRPLPVGSRSVMQNKEMKFSVEDPDGREGSESGSSGE